MKILKIILLLLLVTVALLAAAIFGLSRYIQSAHFSAQLIDYIERTDVASVHDFEPVILTRVYPDIEIRIPKISLTLTDDTSSLKVHLNNLDLGSDLAFIKSEGRAGNVRVSASSVRGLFKTDVSGSESNDLLSSYHLITRSILNEIDAVNVGVRFEAVKYLAIYLDTSTSSEYEITHLLVNKAGNTIQAHYATTDDDIVIQHNHKLSKISVSKQQAITAHYTYSKKHSVGQTLQKVTSEIAFSKSELLLTTFELKDKSHSLAGRLSIRQDNKWAISGKVFLEGDIQQSAKRKPKIESLIAEKSRVLDSKQLPFDLLTQVDAEIELVIPGYRYAGQRLFSGKLYISNKDNRLHIKSKRSKLLNGAIKIKVILDGPDAQPQVDLTVRGFDHELTDVLLLKNNQRLFNSGLFDLDINLQMQGTSIAELFSQSNGKIDLAAREISIDEYIKNLLQLAGIAIPILDNSDTESSLPPVNNKLSEFDGASIDTTNLNQLYVPCFSMKLNIAKGYLVAEDGIILNSGQGLIIGSGIIDFHTEQLLFDARVQKNSPVDLNPFSMLKYTTFSGTLTHPKINLNQNEAIKKGLTTAAALALGFVPSLALTAIQEANAMNKKKLECKSNLFE